MTLTSRQLLESIVSRGHVERPLLAPLCSVIAGEMQGLEPQAFLDNVTKLSHLVRDLTRSLRTDVAVAEFGTLWDAEAMGVQLDWSNGYPPIPKGTIQSKTTPDLTNTGRGSVVLEAIHRLKLLFGEQVIISAGVTGPVRLSHLSGGSLSSNECARKVVLPAVKALSEAGAQLVWVVEDAIATDDVESLANAMTPVWKTIRFYSGIGILHLADAADSWLPFIEKGGAFLPCFDPDLSPSLQKHVDDTGTQYGLALPLEPLSEAASKAAHSKNCVLLTTHDELAGSVPVRDLQKRLTHFRNFTQ